MHCCLDGNATHYIYAGKQNKTIYPEQIKIALSVNRHPLWDEGQEDQYNHDIGLLRLKQLDWTQYVRPVCLPPSDRRLESVTSLRVAGLGVYSHNFTLHDSKAKLNESYITLSELQFAAIDIAESSLCEADNNGSAFNSSINLRSMPGTKAPPNYFSPTVCRDDSGSAAHHKRRKM